MDGYKFLIDDDNEVFAVVVDGIVIPKMKTLGTPFWDQVWNLQYIIDHNLYDLQGTPEILSYEYNEIIFCLKSSQHT